ncbi:cell division ATPase MinD [Halobellus ordinarius]|uniref:cell division ATPase MinD n=1 Tax=Halobellus ordinarius TaxID=3075120 RepID=UPI0028803BC0|nr:cell division ATPase MinD [Halobellus sp. ZY16]
MGRVYAVVSAKGGVGKTTTAANVAASLAAAGSSVVAVDADLGMANLANSLGVTVGDVTLHDVLAGSADVDAAIHEGPHGMAVIPGATDLDAFAGADPEGLEPVLAELRDRYEYVILDTGAGLSNDTVVPLTYVDEALLVSTPTRDALGDTDKTRQVADRLNVTVAGAALTRADPSAVDDDAVVELLDAAVLATIPDAPIVARASDAGEPLTTFAPGSEAAAAFRSLAAALTGESVESDSVPETGTESAAADAESEPESTESPDVEAAGASAESDAPGESTGSEPAAADASASEDPGSDASASEEPASEVDPNEDIVVAGTHEEDLPPDATAPEDEAGAEESPPEPGSDAEDDEDAEPAAPDAEPASEESTADSDETTEDIAAETDDDSAAETDDTASGEELISAAAEASAVTEAPEDEDPLVEPADPAEVMADDPGVGGAESGVYTTSLEDAESSETPESDDVDGEESDPDDESPDAETDSGETDDDAEAEADADNGDGKKKKGLFSRFFG